MGFKEGVNRLSIVLAVVVMVIFTTIIVMIGWNQGFASYGRMITALVAAAVVSILGCLFGIRAVAYIFLWVVEGFKREGSARK